MDKGAHFHCSDFQVHTPRDINWHGPAAASDADRRNYASRFIVACREKGLDAVAITDHHDMAFIPYLREAAASERDQGGNLVSDEDQITIFPGMELTLGIPCQALLLFDANFPQDLFSLALNALAINEAPPKNKSTNQVVRLDIHSFEDLYEMLDKHEYLRGKYIVFPNVSEGGTSTLLRSGHALHYSTMPCVGGYLDGKTDQLGQGNTGILAGKNAEYGYKTLGLFQTSDNRRNDFRELGTSTTWVKWAQPTAEALRQACLARESRISQSRPLTPRVAITSVNVSNSAFLGPVVIELNSQCNAIIGGRGTGKSSILEYIRWGLCDAPSLASSDDDLPDYQNKPEKLVRQTLSGLNATVQVNFILNGVPHSVRRNATTNEVLLKIGAAAFEACDESDVRNLLPIQAYSQKQLSNVGVRLDELRRFIHAPIRQELDDLDFRLKDLASQIRTIHNTLHKKRLLQSEIDNDEREFRSLNEQATLIRKKLAGIGEKEQKILSQRADYDKENEIISAWEADAARLLQAVHHIQELNATFQSAGPDFDSLPNANILKRMNEHLASIFASMNSSLEAAARSLRSIDGKGNPYSKAKHDWQTKFDEFEKAYDEAKKKSTTHQSILNQLSQLDQRLALVRPRLASKKADLTALGTPEQQFADLRDEWCLVHTQRADLVAAECAQLTELAGGQIRASLKRGALLDGLAERLRASFTGANIRSNKIDTLCALIENASEEPIRKCQLVMDELSLLALWDPDSSTGEFTSMPLLREATFTDSELKKIAKKLSPEIWLELCLVPLGDKPVFEYRLREDEYIPFEDASPGQQATALLDALLNQEGPPLIIDQPEDDLNSQVITNIVQHIWQAKQRRQLIFASHNANLVVNGDAELVVCCDYRVAGEQSGGQIKCQGAIDVEEIRNEITTVMEGGREAFKLRKDKYGF